MIPKILHFIWFGPNLPDYAQFSVCQFRKMNPEFKIDLQHWKMSEISRDPILKTLADNIEKQDGKYQNIIKYYRNELGRSIQQTLSNIYRLELLNLHGGIYLDCDCIPLKPFDHQLLDKECGFIVQRHYSSSCIKPDCYFLGKCFDLKVQLYDINSPPKGFEFIIQTEESKTKNKLEELKNLQAFKNLDENCLSMPKNPKFYIYHFNLQAWKLRQAQ